MKDTGNPFEIKRPATSNNIVYIKTAIAKPHGNHKLKIYNRYAKKKKEPKHNTKDSLQITREGKKERKKKIPTKTNPKQLAKWQ